MLKGLACLFSFVSDGLRIVCLQQEGQVPQNYSEWLYLYILEIINYKFYVQYFMPVHAVTCSSMCLKAYCKCISVVFLFNPLLTNILYNGLWAVSDGISNWEIGYLIICV